MSDNNQTFAQWLASLPQGRMVHIHRESHDNILYAAYFNGQLIDTRQEIKPSPFAQLPDENNPPPANLELHLTITFTEAVHDIANVMRHVLIALKRQAQHSVLAPWNEPAHTVSFAIRAPNCPDVPTLTGEP